MLQIQPITLREAQAFIGRHHRHNVAPQGYKFGMAVNNGDFVVGVATVGRPIARHNDDGYTAEVTRVCVLDGYRNANSMLYAACWRAARAMGYKRIITYTLPSESGASLRGAGWKVIGQTTQSKNGWDVPGRPRVVPDKYPRGQKTIWEMEAHP